MQNREHFIRLHIFEPIYLQLTCYWLYDPHSYIIWSRLDDGLKNDIKHTIRSRLSARHVPAVILQTQDIPYTINGKKVSYSAWTLFNSYRYCNCSSCFINQYNFNDIINFLLQFTPLFDVYLLGILVLFSVTFSVTLYIHWSDEVLNPPAWILVAA